MQIDNIKKADPKVAQAIASELKRQRDGIELIASENYTSLAVMEAAGSVMTNKYSEGYPKKRYYGGNQFIDITEQLAIDRAKKLFGAEHANVQPHSGSSANMEVYFALLELGDKILGMSLDHGGHLTHGHKINFSGKHYSFITYGVEQDTCMINMDKVRDIALKEKPKMILCGYSAYSRELDFKAFRAIADEVGALLMCDMAHFAGLVAAKVYPDPIPFCDVVTTTTHKTLRGPRGALILCKEKYAKMIDKAVFPGMQGGPLEHIIAAKAVAFHEALQQEFRDYQAQVIKNAKALAIGLHENGLKIVSGGTENHLMLVDLTETGRSGKEIETALDEVGIFTNKNMIPYDTRSPFDPSGIRIGTPAITTRGFKEDHMKSIAEWISQVVKSPQDSKLKSDIKGKVENLCSEFELYSQL